MATQNHTAWYATILANWLPKLSGPKPTAEMFATVHGWGYRPGLESLHLAMCLRPDGCTVRQFVTAGSCGPANNKRGQVVKRGLATVTVTGDPYAYKLTPTAKGLALIKANAAKAAAVTAPKGKAPAKAATAKGKGKGNGKPKAPRKPKAPPAPAPTVTAEPPVAPPQGDGPDAAA